LQGIARQGKARQGYIYTENTDDEEEEPENLSSEPPIIPLMLIPKFLRFYKETYVILTERFNAFPK
jgi:hypothetical protein